MVPGAYLKYFGWGGRHNAVPEGKPFLKRPRTVALAWHVKSSVACATGTYRSCKHQRTRRGAVPGHRAAGNKLSESRIRPTSGTARRRALAAHRLTTSIDLVHLERMGAGHNWNDPPRIGTPASGGAQPAMPVKRYLPAVPRSSRQTTISRQGTALRYQWEEALYIYRKKLSWASPKRRFSRRRHQQHPRDMHRCAAGRSRQRGARVTLGSDGQTINNGGSPIDDQNADRW